MTPLAKSKFLSGIARPPVSGPLAEIRGGLVLPQNSDSGDLLRQWETERLRRFRHGRKKLAEANGVLATYFDQVEFFRRSHGLSGKTLGHWPALVEFFAEFGQSFLVDLCAHDHETRAALEERAPLEYCYSNTIVRRCLGDFDDRAPQKRSDLQVEVLPVDERTIDVFSRIYLICFEANSTPFEIAQDNINALLGMPGWQPYLARVRGQYAGCYSSFLRGREVFLSSAATLKEFRNLGLQKYMIAHRLAEARRLKTESAVTYGQTGSVSVANLKKLGFVETDEKRTYRCRLAQ